MTSWLMPNVFAALQGLAAELQQNALVLGGTVSHA